MASTLCSKDVTVTVVFQRCDSCVLKKQQLCSKDANFDAGIRAPEEYEFFFKNKSDKLQEQAKRRANFLALNVISCCISNWGGVVKGYGGRTK